MFYVITKKKLISIFVAILIIIIMGLTFFMTSYRYSSGAYSPMAKYTIVLDAGHGGIDKGVQGVNTNVAESDLNLIIVKRLKKYFENAGYKVVLTRETQDGLYGDKSKGFKARDMAKRKKIIEEANADYVISIHLNTYSSSYRRGIQAFYYGSGESESLALNIQKIINTNLNEPFIGRPLVALKGDYYILKCTSAPSVIIECGFLSNPEDESLLLDEQYQDILAHYLFTGINTHISSRQ